MFVNQPLVAAVGAVNQQIMLAGGKDNTRYIPSLNGVDQFYKFALPHTGKGVGSLRIVCKLSDIGDPSFYLIDADESGANRPYVFKPVAALNFANIGGLSVSVNRLNADVVYSELVEILIGGDFTDLLIGTLFARFTGNECAKVQPFSVELEYDDPALSAHNFKYDFTKAALPYVLPEGAFVSRNLVEGVEEGVIAIGSQFVNLAPLGDALVTEWFEVTPGTVLLIDRKNSTRARWQYSANNLVSAEYGGDTIDDVLTVPLGATHLRVYYGHPDDVEPSIEVHKIPNALILQSPSANLADDFEPMVQRGDGHWLGKKNLWEFATGEHNDSGAWGLLAGVTSSLIIEENEAYLASAKGRTDEGEARLRLGSASPVHLGNGLLETEINSYTGSSRLFYQGGASGFVGYIGKTKVHHLIKLSDHIQKQFIIEQTKAAVAAYQTKSRHFNLVFPDGVDDHIELSQPITVVNNSVLSGEFVYRDGEVQEFVAGDDDNTDGVYVDKTGGVIRAFAYVGGSVTAVLEDKEFVPEDGSIHSWALDIAANGVATFYVDDKPRDSAQWSLNGQQKVRYVGRRGSDYSAGSQKNILYINRNNPLPLGQGGQSGFWPLDDPKGSIAANKLGPDKKGKIVAKDGAGLGPELWIYGTAIFDGSHSANKIVAGLGAALTENTWFLVTFSWVNLTGRIRLLLGSDTAIISGNEINNTDSITVLTSSGGLQRLQAQDVVGGSIADSVSISVKQAYGYGEWQGLSPELSEITPVTRDADGALVGDGFTIPLSAELQRQHDLAIVEKQIGKQLKKAERSQELAELDGVDDYISIPRVTFTGGFKIPFFIQHDGVSNRQILGDTENWQNRLSVDSATQIGARIASTTYAFTVPALGSLARWGCLVSEGSTVTLELDGVTYTPDGGAATYAGSPTFNAIGQIANAQFYGGKMGVQPIIDYTDPKASRFYIHDKDAGVFRDVLHPDGSMDGSYVGMPVDLSNIQKFSKKGDDWISIDQLTTVKGA